MESLSHVGDQGFWVIASSGRGRVLVWLRDEDSAFLAIVVAKSPFHQLPPLWVNLGRVEVQKSSARADQ